MQRMSDDDMTSASSPAAQSRLYTLFGSSCLTWASRQLRGYNLGGGTGTDEGVPQQYLWAQHALCIRIRGLSMRKDLRMVQPFVRVHTVQVQSGEYANIAEGSDSAPLRAAPKDTKICPVSTRTECPVWDESLELDGSASQLIRPSVVLLFELLDIPLAIALPETQGSEGPGRRVLAWAFMRTIQTDGVPAFSQLRASVRSTSGPRTAGERDHQPSLSIQERCEDLGQRDEDQQVDADDEETVPDARVLQLYAFQENDVFTTLQCDALNLPPAPQGVSSQRVPGVYAQYRRPNLRALRAVLEVEVLLRRRKQPIVEERKADDALEAVITARTTSSRISVPGTVSQSDLFPHVQRRQRESIEPCVAPTIHVDRVLTQSQGSLCLRFSHSGHFLAIACCEPHIVRLYSTDLSEVVCRQLPSPHVAVVYEVSWSLDDHFLLTAGGDGRCKVYDMRSLLPDPSGEQAPSRTPQLLCELRYPMPCFVYSAIFVLSTGSGETTSCQPVLSGGFDKRLRLWNPTRLTLPAGELIGKLHHNKHINVVVQDVRSRMIFSADAGGVIMAWRMGEGVDGSEIAHYTLVRKLKHPELDGRSIFSLSIHSGFAGSRLLVLAHSTMLKLFDLATFKTLHDGFLGVDVGCSLTRACISPDGTIVACGTALGRVMMFNAQTANVLETHVSLIRHARPVRCIDWHPSQHLIAVAMYGAQAPVVLYANEKG